MAVTREDLVSAFRELILTTANRIPADVYEAIRDAYMSEITPWPRPS